MPSKTILSWWLAASALWVLAGCGAVSGPEEQPKSALGTGSYGTDVSSQVTQVTVTDSLGKTVGHFEYDSQQFTPLYQASDASDGLRVILSAESGALQVTAAKSLGRADTACRYQVALLARDQDFELGLAGWKTNPQGLDVYWASANRTDDYRAFYCALLSDTAGVAIQAQATDAQRLEAKILMALLGSLTKG
ncbi:MAG: hypothetical protein RRB13_10965 [bacterium]|nr:hypothetical protein [bacterium]